MAVQGYPRSLISVPIKSAYATFHWSSIVSLVISCTVQRYCRFSVQNSDPTRIPLEFWSCSRQSSPRQANIVRSSGNISDGYGFFWERRNTFSTMGYFQTNDVKLTTLIEIIKVINDYILGLHCRFPWHTDGPTTPPPPPTNEKFCAYRFPWQFIIVCRPDNVGVGPLRPVCRRLYLLRRPGSSLCLVTELYQRTFCEYKVRFMPGIINAQAQWRNSSRPCYEFSSILFLTASPTFYYNESFLWYNFQGSESCVQSWQWVWVVTGLNCELCVQFWRTSETLEWMVEQLRPSLIRQT